MDDLISRQAAIEALGERPAVWMDSDYEIAQRNQWDIDKLAIETVPAADVRENVRWEWKRTVTGHPYCSSCNWFPEENEMTGFFYDFCPNCGSDMRGEE